MIVLNTKTFDELKEEATSDLQAVGFSTSAGSIAKLFMNVVNKNIANLDIQSKSRVILSDWKKALNTFATQNIKFDLIFIDPPYAYDVYEKILNKVSTLNLLSDNGLIIMEHSNLHLPTTYENLTLYKERNYGNKSINIYIKKQ